jgi:site-specific recombinase XerC
MRRAEKLVAVRCRSGAKLCGAQSPRGLGPASLALRLSALRSFFDWLVGQGELSANPAKGIAAPKIPRHLPKNIDVDDVNRLLDIDLNDPLAVRDRAMLEVMYGAGCVCPSWSTLISNTSISKAVRSG